MANPPISLAGTNEHVTPCLANVIHPPPSFYYYALAHIPAGGGKWQSCTPNDIRPVARTTGLEGVGEAEGWTQRLLGKSCSCPSRRALAI